MFGLKNMSIRTRLYGLVAVAVLGFGTVVLLTAWLSSKYKVNGPLYDRLMLRQGAISDFSPPYLSLVESEIIIDHLLIAKDEEETREYLHQLAKAHRAYTESRTRWERELYAGPVKSILEAEIYPPAEEFFRLANSEFLPLLRKAIAPRRRNTPKRGWNRSFANRGRRLFKPCAWDGTVRLPRKP